ncbi:MAG: thiolase family protein [Candidatus Thermoplasmatota archaeon]|nr:thiolase family protein [Candidatus Thermoplasmatota archaeon]
MSAITGATTIPFGRGLEPARLVRAAADRALQDAGLSPEDVEAVVVANAAAEAFCDIGNVAVWTTTEAGLVDAMALRVETGPSSGLAGFQVATALVDAGRAQRVLLLGWEVMTQVTTEAATQALARYMSRQERDHGLSLPALVAMLTSAYQARYGLPDEELARIPVAAHELAVANPVAQFRKTLTVEDVLTSRIIADPLRLYHCAPLTDGAAAVVVEPEGPVQVQALAGATDQLGYARRATPPERFEATRTAGRAAFQQAGWSRDQVDVVEVHDAFSVLEAVALEDLGFAKPGTGLDHVLAGKDPGASQLLVNPGGGLKARGHPVGATGVSQLSEAYDQLTGRAANQAHDAQRALVHSIGGFGNNVHVSLLEATS